MTSMEWSLPLIWAAIIGAAVALYVILDGFDLGIGMLFPFTEDESERNQMMASIAPFWDGNETWLVMGGVGLLVAFPLAYAIVMPAFYLPVIAMLLALVFRGIAFEFREIGHNKMLWNAAFAGGSTLAAFCQGVILGGMVQGIAVANNAYVGGPFDWLTPFAMLCGFGVATGYALLGATWLVMKTSGPVTERARTHAEWLLYAVLAFMAAVSLWTPLAFPQIGERWFSLPNVLYLWPVPLLTALTAYVAWRALRRGHDATPFVATIVLFLLSFAGLVISSFPYLVRPSLTIWQTAAAPGSQWFMLAGTLVLLPLILAYTAYVYWLFRGKIGPGQGYH
jgi:cytochrome d ubiquinol oxidase subunit II